MAILFRTMSFFMSLCVHITSRRSEMMAYIFLGIIVALALYWLFAHENPAKEE